MNNLNKFLAEMEYKIAHDFDTGILKNTVILKTGDALKLIELVKIQSASLKFYSNKDFDRVCFLDHSTCEQEYGADARAALQKSEEICK